MFSYLFSHTGTRILNKHRALVSEIRSLAKSMSNLEDEQFQERTKYLQKICQDTSNSKQILPEAFAIVTEVLRRTIGLVLFDVQLLCGILLSQGCITEMKTGEGKTVVSVLSAYLHVLQTQETVHIITVNDYLSQRDSDLLRPVYQRLGLSVGVVQNTMSPHERKKNYSADIVYLTNSELGFDYLRDNMAIDVHGRVQSPFSFCIIDEVDSILIDEARTPLIISGSSVQKSDKYQVAHSVVQELTQNQEYEIEEKTKSVSLTDKGIRICEDILQTDDLYSLSNPWAQYLLNAIRAKELFIKNQHYILRENQVIIVDEFTGRIMPGRRWSDGLHQAIEVKEKVPIQSENKTLASITYQNLFLLYPKLSGMTGTAVTEKREFSRIYNLDVIEVPTNKQCIRKDLDDLIYRREYDKWLAIAHECLDMFRIGRPVLVGTTNIEKSELLASVLQQYDVPFNLLNARPENVERESYIISQAGRSHTITIATNMAGRGTDIILGGNPILSAKSVLHGAYAAYLKNDLPYFIRSLDFEIQPLIRECIVRLAADKHIQNTSLSNFKSYIDQELLNPLNTRTRDFNLKKQFDLLCKIYAEKFKADRDLVVQLGGLYVIGTERHESRRIDNQLRGRAGRQGDPGTSRFFLSLEDSLLKIFGGPTISKLMSSLQVADNVPIESSLLSSSLENAQKKVEAYYYEARKQLFQYDDVLNSQRQAIYAERNRILSSDYIRDCIIEYAESTLDEVLRIYDSSSSDHMSFLLQKLSVLLNISLPKIQAYIYNMDRVTLKYVLYNQFRVSYDLKEAYLEHVRPGLIRQLERYYLLQQIDEAWQEHLECMTNLRESIGWRTYGQQDPLIEYKNEAFKLFIDMIKHIRETVIYLLMRSRLVIESS